EITVLLGAHNITNTERSTDDGRFNVTITIHDDYSKGDFADIALLELQNKANITTQKIRPACLPKSNGNDILEFRAAGFGKNGENIASALSETTLETHPIEKCKYVTTSKLNITMQLCATPMPRGRSGGDVCPGDSGGPIFIEYPGRNDCLYAVMGIVSVGNVCNVEGALTIHTRVWPFREWIES
ncbi:hypothetical protein KR044_001921, partial [Drosophila immigrans]